MNGIIVLVETRDSPGMSQPLHCMNVHLMEGIPLSFDPRIDLCSSASGLFPRPHSFADAETVFEPKCWEVPPMTELTFRGSHLYGI